MSCDHRRVKRRKSFAEIVAEAKAEPTTERDIRPGGYNAAGDLFDRDGNLLERIGEVTPSEAQRHVRDGAQLAWESCGCGGWSGCLPTWVEDDIRGALGDGPTPQFTRRHHAPTWIDLWQGDGGPVIYAHGDIKWSNALE
jgi:hypothetical protein